MRFNISIYIVYTVVLILILQPLIVFAIPTIAYYDEIVALLFFGYYLLCVLKSGKISKSLLKLIGLITLLVIIGLIGNDKSQSGQSLVSVLTDIVSNTKLFLFAIPLFSFSFSFEKREQLMDWLATTIRIVILCMFICASISIFKDIGMSDEVRYGIRSFRFIFVNPAGLNTYFYSFMVVFSATLFKNGKLRPKSNFYMIIAVITWILTLRSRAIAFACIYVLLYFLIIYYVNSKDTIKFRWYYLPPILVVACLIGWPAFEEYFLLNSRQARYVLLRGAISLAKDYFPFGTGFATYGTSASATQYSSIYARYGLSSVWGLGPDSSFFIMDQFWCGILGQFGVLGTVLIAYLIYRLYKEVLRRSRGNKSLLLASSTLIYTSLFASISAASYIQASIFISVFVIFVLTVPPVQGAKE